MKALAYFGGFVLGVIGFAASTTLNGYVISTAWGWFLVPTLNVPQLPVVPAIGLSLIVSCIMYHAVSHDEKKEEDFGEVAKKSLKAIGESIIKSLVILALCYLVHLFM